MQDTHITDIDTIANRILPITDLRRNPGEAFKKLEKTGGFIITKDGKPIGKLLPIKEDTNKLTINQKLKRLKSLSGGLKLGGNLTPQKIHQLIDKSYEENS